MFFYNTWQNRGDVVLFSQITHVFFFGKIPFFSHQLRDIWSRRVHRSYIAVTGILYIILFYSI